MRQVSDLCVYPILSSQELLNVDGSFIVGFLHVLIFVVVIPNVMSLSCVQIDCIKLI